MLVVFYFFLVPRFIFIFFFYRFFLSFSEHSPFLIRSCPLLPIKLANLGVKPSIGPLCPPAPFGKSLILLFFFFCFPQLVYIFINVFLQKEIRKNCMIHRKLENMKIKKQMVWSKIIRIVKKCLSVRVYEFLLLCCQARHGVCG